MVAGRSYTASVTMKNTGKTTWTSAANYTLGSENPADNVTWRTNRVKLTSTVAPGQNHTFTFTVTAPTATGTYNFQWKMVREFNVTTAAGGSMIEPLTATATFVDGARTAAGSSRK